MEEQNLAGFDPDQARDKTGKWTTGLGEFTQDDRSCIEHYTAYGFIQMNKYLHTGSVIRSGGKTTWIAGQPVNQNKINTNITIEDLERKIECLKGALRKLQGDSKYIANGPVVYRGDGFNNERDFLRFKFNVQHNTQIEFPAFLSTSRSQNTAQEFGIYEDYKVHIAIFSKTGIDVQDFSQNETEAEVLFLPKTKFRIKEADTRGISNSIWVTLEEI